VPAGPAELSITIDGIDAHAAGGKRPWFVSIPRVHQDFEGDERPNVLVITVDTLRADYLRCYGHDRPTSSNLDGLAKAGVVFERNLAQASWTLPSYSSCFSGQYTEAHGVTHRDHRFSDRFVTWLELLARDGYALGGFVSGTFTDAHWGMDQGFDEYDDLGMVVNEAHVASTQAHNGLTPDQPEAMRTAAHRRLTSPEIANKSIAFLDRHRDRRFCLLAHFFDPHEDYVRHPKINPHFPDRPVPPNFPNQVDRFPEVTERMRALYEAEIAYTDFHIGRVLKRLVELGLAEKTVVVVFSDHGEAFKEHILDPRPENDGVNCGHGSSLFNEQIHVPLIVRAPGVAPGRVKTPTGNIDIGPTVLELCGIDPGEWTHHGHSLVHAMRTKEPDPERLVFSSMFRAMPAEGDPDGKRRQVAHRVDQGDLSALTHGRLESLHRWSDRWQDPAKNLLQQEGDTFRRLEETYVERRSRLEALQHASEETNNQGLKDILAELGYIGE
jgi:arylsulfatase A-like enzyme